MSQSKRDHTPGPLQTWPSPVYCANNSRLPTEVKTKYGNPSMDRSQLVPFQLGQGVNQEANGLRLVILWNAFDGVRTEEIPEHIRGLRLPASLYAENRHRDKDGRDTLRAEEEK